MSKRIRIFVLSLLAIGAMAFGAATLATAGGTGEKPGQESSAPENSASDGDNVQYTPPGERAQATSATAHKKKTHARHRKAHRRHAVHGAQTQSQSGSQSGSSQGETQGESSESNGESGSGENGNETSGNDGPGGHADGQGNVNHEFNGQE
jgi:hypothetical protein